MAAAVLCAVAIAASSVPARADLPKVPEGFKIRLVAAVPAVQYPCQVATAPDGSLFVGEDPMDQVGPATKPIDRILLFRDGKDPVVFADKLNAMFRHGLARRGTLRHEHAEPHRSARQRWRRQGGRAQRALHQHGRSRRHTE